MVHGLWQENTIFANLSFPLSGTAGFFFYHDETKQYDYL